MNGEQSTGIYVEYNTKTAISIDMINGGTPRLGAVLYLASGKDTVTREAHHRVLKKKKNKNMLNTMGGVLQPVSARTQEE